ncbi:MAG TPA: hypothetical protein VFV38_05440 [Ktedonobacteraceae bacterium]|nr:hypothetical protein [Ktedonobacteraceae bacterium]
MALPYLSSPPIARTEKEGQCTMIQSGNIHPETISPLLLTLRLCSHDTCAGQPGAQEQSSDAENDTYFSRLICPAGDRACRAVL